MAVNKDELHAPSWMTEAFFEKVLRQSEADQTITVASCKMVPGTKPGDHFASIIFRATVEYRSHGKDRTVSLIVKTMPVEEGMKKDMLSGTLFETETIMFGTVLPEMHRVLRSVGDNTELGPRLLYSVKEPHVVMVFEDIAARNYIMKYSQLDLSDAKLVYAKLARWHAASLFLEDSCPAIKKLDVGFGNYESGKFLFIWTEQLGKLIKVIAEWKGFESYSERLDNIKEQLMKKLFEIYTSRDRSIYNVLNHGDLHFKNMMYQIEEGKTKDILLLDYQLSIWGSPAIDIIYSLYNTCSIETRDNHRNELIKFYHDEFVSVLNCLGYLKKIPSLLDLHIEITKCGHLETFLACIFMPFMLLSFDDYGSKPEAKEEIKEDGEDKKDEVFDYADKQKMEDMIFGAYRHPKFVETLKKYLPMYLHRGLLDL
ncbi:uncharacterized protein LOC129757106 [Uranotaenia lowii]|uniref:uncharacterized protein LOC129757106 n=1 Tax=Uranotaenia lowii TaxID=190385 RepID=UPI0024785879|nr:uncharacterized protein LOC129757106 [Uranotaenia lowii]